MVEKGCKQASIMGMLYTESEKLPLQVRQVMPWGLRWESVEGLCATKGKSGLDSIQIGVMNSSSGYRLQRLRLI